MEGCCSLYYSHKFPWDSTCPTHKGTHQGYHFSSIRTGSIKGLLVLGASCEWLGSSSPHKGISLGLGNTSSMPKISACLVDDLDLFLTWVHPTTCALILTFAFWRCPQIPSCHANCSQSLVDGSQASHPLVLLAFSTCLLLTPTTSLSLISVAKNLL